MESKSLEMTIKEVGRETIYEGLRSKVKLNYYWDSHGKLIPWENDGQKSKTFENVKVKVDEVERTIPSIGDYKWKEWQVTLNGERVNALDCCEYYTTQSGTMVFKMIVGQG